MNTKIANTANYLSVLILLGMGMTYLFKNSFMPYHSDAVSLEWSEVEKSTQILILALMRAASGGYIVTAFIMAFLQYKFNSTKTTWLPKLILISGMITCITSIYATLIVRLYSPGKPPTTLAIVGIILLIIGYYFNRKTLDKK